MDTYPCTFKEYSSNREVLDRIIADLQTAKELVKPFDTAEEHAYWMTTNARIENFEGSGVGNPPSDIFFTYRGYRMNYYAICAALARAYNYAGPYDAENYKRAFDETQPIIDGAYEGNPYFTFTYPSTGNTRLYHDVIFCLSNQKTVTNYSDATADNTKFYINDASYLFDDQSDVRYAVLLNTTSYNVLSLKYSDESNSYCADLLPVLRLSEKHCPMNTRCPLPWCSARDCSPTHSRSCSSAAHAWTTRRSRSPCASWRTTTLTSVTPTA